jgi:hypothetical protein
VLGVGLGDLFEAFRAESSAEGFRVGQVGASASGTLLTRQVWRAMQRLPRLGDWLVTLGSTG